MNQAKAQINHLLQGYKEVNEQLKDEKTRSSRLEKELEGVKTTNQELRKTIKSISDLSGQLKNNLSKEVEFLEKKLTESVLGLNEEQKKDADSWFKKTTTDYLNLLTSLVDRNLKLNLLKQGEMEAENVQEPLISAQTEPYKMECESPKLSLIKLRPPLKEPQDNLETTKKTSPILRSERKPSPKKVIQYSKSASRTTPLKLTIPRGDKVLKVTNREILDAKGDLSVLEREK